MVAGPGRTAICDECVSLAAELVRERATPSGDMVLHNIGTLVTNDPRFPGLTGRVTNAAVAVRGGKILWAGPAERIPVALERLPGLDCGGRAVIPGFVDAHTHLLFVGDRARDFERRLAGATGEEVMLAGGGAPAVTATTREAPRGRLITEVGARLQRMLASGTTTVEVQSGYGGDAPSERMLLDVARHLDRAQPVDLVTTLHLGIGGAVLHVDGKKGFIEDAIAEIIPFCREAAVYCSVGSGDGVYDPAEARLLLGEAHRAGLGAKLHAGGADVTETVRLAAELGVASIEHPGALGAEDIAVIAKSGVVAVLSPAAALIRGHGYGPARSLWMAGARVALSTGCSPVGSYVERMPFVVALGVLEMGLTPDQALWSATRGGAAAIEEPDKGWIGQGAVADLVVLDTANPAHMAYRPDADLIWKVFKNGELAAG